MNIIVVGDLALDINSFGRYKGFSREIEGLPIFHVERQTFNGGGAANLAGNLAKLGNRVWAVGCYGADFAGQQLLSWFNDNNIVSMGIYESSRTQVFGKYWLYDRHRDRIDVDPDEATPELFDALCESIDYLFSSNDIDATIVADYNELDYDTVVTKDLMDWVAHKPCTTFITSRENIKSAVGYDYVVGNNDELGDCAIDLTEKNSRVIMTTGKNGAEILGIKNGGDWMKQVKSKPAEPPIDPCGCGDTFLAVFATKICEGMPEIDAIKWANAGARWTTKQIGTTGYPTQEDLGNEYSLTY